MVITAKNAGIFCCNIQGLAHGALGQSFWEVGCELQSFRDTPTLGFLTSAIAEGGLLHDSRGAGETGRDTLSLRTRDFLTFRMSKTNNIFTELATSFFCGRLIRPIFAI